MKKLTLHFQNKKKCHVTPLSPLNGHLSTTVIFLCPQGGCCERFHVITSSSIVKLKKNPLVSQAVMEMGVIA